MRLFPSLCALLFAGILVTSAPLSSQMVTLEDTAVFGGTDPFFEVGVGGTTFSATPSTFGLGTAGTNRLLVVPIAWRNSTVSSITFGGEALTPLGVAQSTTGDYFQGFYYLPESGITAASDSEFVITMATDANTSLIFQALMLSNAEQAPSTFLSNEALAVSPPDLPPLTLSGLPANGFGLAGAGVNNSGSATLGTIDPITFSWVQDLSNELYNGQGSYTGGKYSTATIEFSSGGDLTSDWTAGTAFTAQNLLGTLAYVAPVPEPGSLALAAVGAGALLLLAFAKKRSVGD